MSSHGVAEIDASWEDYAQARHPLGTSALNPFFPDLRVCYDVIHVTTSNRRNRARALFPRSDCLHAHPEKLCQKRLAGVRFPDVFDVSRSVGASLRIESYRPNCELFPNGLACLSRITERGQPCDHISRKRRQPFVLVHSLTSLFKLSFVRVDFRRDRVSVSHAQIIGNSFRNNGPEENSPVCPRVKIKDSERTALPLVRSGDRKRAFLSPLVPGITVPISGSVRIRNSSICRSASVG